jgi:phospholipid-binding lipoprotein MlaA
VIRAARNALDNLDEPSTAANDLLQRKLASAGRTAARFLINSTVGVGGLFDVAAGVGLERRKNSLDRTLASYGAPAGPYLYLPVTGPTTLRGVLAMAAESYFYPTHWLHLAAGVGPVLKGAGYVKLAARAVKHADGGPGEGRQGPDAYARTRSAYYAAANQPVRTAQSGGPARPTTLASLSRED